MDLGNRRVLVTGAAGEIGMATARSFAASGARLALTDHDADALEKAATTLRDEGARVDVEVSADIRRQDSVQHLFHQIEDRWSGLDAAFNNAGRGGGEVPLDRMDDEHWLDILQTNLTGTFFCLRAEIQLMLRDGGGAIVNNSSILGIHGGANAAYTASKHGVSGLTKSAAIQYAQRGIRINAVCPGLIDAGMGKKVLAREQTKVQAMLDKHPIGRAGTAEEVAGAVVWLCSDAASYVTGHLMPVDGGYSAW